jgi:hypothetical protein
VNHSIFVLLLGEPSLHLSLFLLFPLYVLFKSLFGCVEEEIWWDLNATASSGPMNQDSSGPSHVPGATPPSATAAASTHTPGLHDSFHRRQAQALHLFLYPRHTVADEAAAEHSPSLSSSAEEEGEENGGAGSVSPSSLLHGDIALPVSLPWRGSSGSFRPLTPLLLPQPSVLLGEGWAAGQTAEQCGSPQPISTAAVAMKVSVIGGDRSGTSLYGSAEGFSLEESLVPPHTREQADRREGESEGKDVASTTPCEDAPLPSDFIEETRAAASSLPCCHVATTTTTAAFITTADARRVSSLLSCEGAVAESPSDVTAPSCGFPSGRARDATPLGVPVLVVWRAETNTTGVGSSAAPNGLLPPVHPARPQEPVSALPESAGRYAAAHSGEARQVLGGVERGMLHTALLQAPRAAAGSGASRVILSPDEISNISGGSSSSDTEGEDVFEDNGGYSGCLLNVCLSFCIWLYHLVMRCGAGCCVWLRCAWCDSSWCSCRHPGGLWGGQVRDLAEVGGSEGDDDDEDAEGESQLYRPLLFSSVPHRTAFSPASAPKRTSPSAMPSALWPLPPHSHPSLPSTQPLPSSSSPPRSSQTPTPRAAQALCFSDYDEDGSRGSLDLHHAWGSGKLPAIGAGQQAQRHLSSHTLSASALPDPSRDPQRQQRTVSDESSTATSRGDGSYPSATSRLRWLSKKLSRYSLSEAYAYFNVFADPDLIDVPDVGAPSTTSTKTFTFTRSFLAQRDPALSAPSDGTSLAATAPSQNPLTEGVGHHTGLPPFATARVRRRKGLSRVSAAGQVFVLFHYLACAILTAAVVVLAVVEFRHDVVATVSDDTTCNRFPYRDRTRPDFSFSLICFLLNSLLAIRYAVRAVRYEKGGLLVVQVIIMLLQLGRAAYFLLFVIGRYLRLVGTTGATATMRAAMAATSEQPHRSPLLLFTWISVLSSVVLFLLASLMIPWVYASFGWRRYAQGIVSVRLARVRQRLTMLQTCVQLDRVITLNAYLASVFLLDTWSDQRGLLCVTGVALLLYALLVPSLRRTRHWWPLAVAGCVLLAVSGSFSALIADSFRKDHQLRQMSSSPWYSACYTDQLPECLRVSPVPYPITIYRDEDDTAQGGRTLAAVVGSSPYRRATPAEGASPFVNTHYPRVALFSITAVPATFPGSVAVTTTAPSLQRVDNASDTYIPTCGVFRDYFRIAGCNEECFAEEEAATQHRIVHRIALCCSYYGQCRLKDAYRPYAVMLLMLLATLSYVVRVVLLAVAWRRFVGRDDAAIEVFLQDKRERCRSGGRRRPRWPTRHPREPREAVEAGRRIDVPPCWPTPSSPLPPREPLIWNVYRYDAWRNESGGGW